MNPLRYTLGPWLVAGLLFLAFLPIGPVAADDKEKADKNKVEKIDKDKADKADKVEKKHEPPPPPAITFKSVPESAADLKSLQMRVRHVLKTAKPATVGLFIGASAGSGVIVSEDGYVLTAGHVSGDPDQEALIILADGRKLKGKTLGKNDNIDSGMIKIKTKEKLPFVKMGKSDKLKLGDWVVAVGHPGGQRDGRPPVVRVGRIVDKTKTWLQTDCALVGGDSGGPLYNLDGEVIGIHSRINRPITVNIHVPINTYHDTWDRLAAGESWGGFSDLLGMFKKDSSRGSAGFDLDAELKVTRVDKGGSPGKAGLQVGDVIQKVNGKQMRSKSDVAEQLARLSNEEVVLVIDRDGERETITYRNRIEPKRKGKTFKE